MGTVRVAGWVAWVTGSAVGKPVKTADHYSNRKKNNKLATANLEGIKVPVAKWETQNEGGFWPCGTAVHVAGSPGRLAGHNTLNVLMLNQLKGS